MNDWRMRDWRWRLNDWRRNDWRRNNQGGRYSRRRLNCRSSGVRRLDACIRTPGGGRYLAPEFQQLTMQRIVLFRIQFGQIPQLPTKLILLPGTQSHRGYSEHDADGRLAQG